jgi:hypothetical protein
MDALREELENYFGMVNEIRMGLSVTPVPKPPELIMYEQVVGMGIPLLAGGVMDQPHIWLMQYALIRNVKDMFDAIASANSRARSNDGKHEANGSV